MHAQPQRLCLQKVCAGMHGSTCMHRQIRWAFSGWEAWKHVRPAGCSRSVRLCCGGGLEGVAARAQVAEVGVCQDGGLLKLRRQQRGL
jgi:hypothetical protein